MNYMLQIIILITEDSCGIYKRIQLVSFLAKPDSYAKQDKSFTWLLTQIY